MLPVRAAGLEFDDEVVVIFGSPAVGTRLMRESPVAGLDLPPRMLVWREAGTTHVAYSDSHSLAGRFGFERSESVLNGMAALLSGLVDEIQEIQA